MSREKQISTVIRLVREHTNSPSMRHIRDYKIIETLAVRIVDEMHHPSVVWTKWWPHREELIRAAAPTWIPDADLRDALNDMPGPKLTPSDVAQRLKVVQEELSSWPDEHFREACIELYQVERKAGTEMIAIAGAIRDYIEQADAERRKAVEKRWRAQREADKLALEARFLSGADCGWTPVTGSSSVWCRRNGRTYRLERRKDGRQDMFRCDGVDDRGLLVGTYATRADASKAVKVLAYQPELQR